MLLIAEADWLNHRLSHSDTHKMCYFPILEKVRLKNFNVNELKSLVIK